MKIINRVLTRKSRLVGILLICTSLVLLLFTQSYDASKDEMVVISTEFGEITVGLYKDTPLHRENFLKLVKESYYDSLLFHRVISGFMIQGGDPDSRGAKPGAPLGRGGPGYTVPAEIIPTHIHKKGALAAARQGDQVNPERASSGSQFYIVQGKPVPSTQLDRIAEQRSFTNSADTSGYSPEQVAIYQSIGGTPHLDGAYTVFGEVVEGLEVVDLIAQQEVDRRSRPLKDIKMSMKIIRKRWP